MLNQTMHWLENNHGDDYLSTINPLSFLYGSAQVVFEHNYNDDFSDEKQLYICIGTDSGLLIHFVKSKIKPSSHCVFVELEHVYTMLDKAGLLNSLPNNIKVSTYDKWFDAAKESQIDAYVAHEQYQLKPSLAAVECHEFQ